MNDLDALWGRWVAGADLDALGELFDETAPRLRRLAQFMARDAAAADDALQGTYLAALERPMELGEDGRVEAWLSGILVRQVRRQHRVAGGGSAVAVGPEALADVESNDRSPAGQAAGAELEGRVGALIDGLPESYAEPLRRKLLGGDSAQTIAADLGLEPSTVHTRVSRGLAKLRKALPAGLAAPAIAQSASEEPAAAALASMKTKVLANAGAKPALAAGTTAAGGKAGGAASWMGPKGGLYALLSLVVAGGLWWLSGSPMGDAATTPTTVERGSLAAAGRADEPRVAAVPDLPETQGSLRTEAVPAPPRKRWTGTVVPRIPGVRVHRLEEGTLRPVELLATTEEGGRFDFSGPADLEHQIGFFLEGHTVWASPLSEAQRLRSDRDSSRQVEGDTIWFGDPRLLPGARVAGRAVDSRGLPVAGATLYVTPGRMLASDQHDRPFGVTAQDGSFELDSAVAHENSGQVLFAVAPDGRTGWTPFGCPEGKRAITDLEVTIHDVFSGRVQVLDDESGEAINDATVRLSPASDRPFEHSQSGRATMFESRVRHFVLGAALDGAWSARTGPDGWAELLTIPATPGQGIQFDGVRPFACWVTATAVGYEVAPSQVIRALPEGGTTEIDPRWKQLFPEAVTLRMTRAAEQPAPTAGAIDEAAKDAPDAPPSLPLSIRVVDESGAGLDGFRVSATRGEHSLGRGGLWNDGRWRWSDADAGEWTVKIYDPIVLRDFMRPPFHTVTLRGSEDEHLIRTVRPAPEPAGQVTLQIRSKGALAPLDPTAWYAFREQPDGRFQTERASEAHVLEGALRLENMPPGNWWIKVRARGHDESEIRFVLADGDDRVLQIELPLASGR